VWLIDRLGNRQRSGCHSQGANEVIKNYIRQPLFDLFKTCIRRRSAYSTAVHDRGKRGRILKEEDIDGALVGGASLKPDFIEISRQPLK
jgi:triosephosphate isomerase